MFLRATQSRLSTPNRQTLSTAQQCELLHENVASGSVTTKSILEVIVLRSAPFLEGAEIEPLAVETRYDGKHNPPFHLLPYVHKTRGSPFPVHTNEDVSDNDDCTVDGSAEVLHVHFVLPLLILIG